MHAFTVRLTNRGDYSLNLVASEYVWNVSSEANNYDFYKSRVFLIITVDIFEDSKYPMLYSHTIWTLVYDTLSMYHVWSLKRSPVWIALEYNILYSKLFKIYLELWKLTQMFFDTVPRTLQCNYFQKSNLFVLWIIYNWTDSCSTSIHFFHWKIKKNLQ